MKESPRLFPTTMQGLGPGLTGSTFAAGKKGGSCHSTSPMLWGGRVETMVLGSETRLHAVALGNTSVTLGVTSDLGACLCDLSSL